MSDSDGSEPAWNHDQELRALRESLSSRLWNAEMAHFQTRTHHGKKCLNVAQLVRIDQIEEAILLTKLSFASVHERDVEEIISLVYQDINNLKPLFEFLSGMSYANLDMTLLSTQVFKVIMRKASADQSELQLLKTFLDETSFGLDLSRIIADCFCILDQMCEGIRSNNHEACRDLLKSLGDTHLELIVFCFYHEATLEDTLLLLQFAHHLQLQCTVVTGAVRRLERLGLLWTERGMHVWVVAHQLMLSGEQTMEFRDIYHKLSKHRYAYLENFYLRYVDSPDDKRLVQMHQSNRALRLMLSEFVTFYLDGDLRRLRRLQLVAQTIGPDAHVAFLLSLMHEHWSKRSQMDTFEAFQIYALANQHIKSDDFESLSAETRALYQQLLLQAPLCALLLLGRTSHYHLVNKATKKMLSSTPWSDVSSLGGSKMLIKISDQHHVKLFSVADDGYLTSDPRDHGEINQAYFAAEDGTDQQLWRVQFAPTG